MSLGSNENSFFPKYSMVLMKEMELNQQIDKKVSDIHSEEL